MLWSEKPMHAPMMAKGKYKIFFVRPTLGQGGADRVTLTLLQSLDRARFDLTLVLVQHKGELLPELPDDVSITALNAPNVLAAALPLLRFVREQRPDVLFSTSSGTNVAAVIAHLGAGRPGRLVLSERNVLFHGKITWKKRLMTWLKRQLYTKADRVTAVSEGVKADLVATLGLSPELVSVVYNPIVTASMATQARELPAEPWFHEGQPPVILGVGRLVDEKDFPTLLRAFARVRATHPARLIILGEGPRREMLEELVGILGLTNDVRMPGFVHNPFQYMARCAAFVLSSRFEGLPGALIQAMACGAPVVSTNCPSGPAEIITDGVDGFLVPVGDADAIAARLTQLLTDTSLRQRFSIEAHVSAQRFDGPTVLRRYEAVLTNSSTRATSITPR